MIDGLGRTTQGFESMSIPVAIFSAAFVTVVEVVGGVLVILGALLTVVAACYLVVMVGAAVFVHIPNGIFVAAQRLGARRGDRGAAAGAGRGGVRPLRRGPPHPVAPLPRRPRDGADLGRGVADGGWPSRAVSATTTPAARRRSPRFPQVSAARAGRTTAGPPPAHARRPRRTVGGADRRADPTRGATLTAPRVRRRPSVFRAVRPRHSPVLRRRPHAPTMRSCRRCRRRPRCATSPPCGTSRRCARAARCRG